MALVELNHPFAIILSKLFDPFQNGQLGWDEKPVIEITIDGFGYGGPVVANLALRDDDGHGELIVIELYPTKEEDLPETELSETEPAIHAGVKVIVSHFLPPGTSIFLLPEAGFLARFVFLHEDEFVICNCYTANTAKGEKKLRDEEFRLRDRERQQAEKQLALERKQAALEQEASLRHFPDVASMLAADAAEVHAQAEAKRLQRDAEIAERDRAEAAAAAAVKAKKAEEARERKAAKDAKVEAERLANFGGKKGSPPPSSGSSRSASNSPPPPSGGQAVARR
jgi:hypothetical protein